MTTSTTTTLPAFCKGLSEERFDLLLDLSSWMRTLSNSETHYCDEAYLDLQQEFEELAHCIKSEGWTYEQVEEFTFA